MAKSSRTRSPQYPAIGLREAVEKVQQVYDQDYQNKISREIVAQHMGYAGLNGKSLKVLSATTKYGLLEGRGDEVHVSDLALQVIAHPVGSLERLEALKQASSKPILFAELDARFSGGKASDQAIKSWLLTQKFIPLAAETVLKSYKETKSFVEEEMSLYNEEHGISEDDIDQPNEEISVPSCGGEDALRESRKLEQDRCFENQRRAVFALAEGDVIIEYPAEMSLSSVDDLQDYIEIFLRRARRDAVQ